MEHPLNHLLPAAAVVAVPAAAAAPATAARPRGRPRKDRTVPVAPKVYPRVLDETADTVPTDQAAFYLRRGVATLRTWSTADKAPLRPIKTAKGAPLAWSMAEIRRFLRIDA